MTTPNWGLVLSGGAAWGLANLGVIEALEEEGLRPSCVAGSSMGAIVGALYALGHSTKDLRKIAEEMKPLTVASISEKFFKDGLHGGFLRQQLDTHLSPLIGDATIGECTIPFVCIAGRVKSKVPWHTIMVDPHFTEKIADLVEPYEFPPETRVLDALLASSAIPVVFSPAVIGNDEFVDLVAFGALPARTLRERYHPQILIGTDCNPRYDNLRDWLPGGWKAFIENGLKQYELSQQACDFIIHPEFRTGTFRFDKALEFVEAGRKAAVKSLPDIKSLLRNV